MIHHGEPTAQTPECTCYASYFSPSVARRKGYEYEIKHCPLHAAAPALLAALEAVEFLEFPGLHHMGPICPTCGRAQDNHGHSDDCQLQAALKAARGED